MAGITKVFQATVFINGVSAVEKVEEADIPVPTATTATHETISSLGSVDLATGFDAMMARFKWKGVNEELETIISNPYAEASIQVRFNIEKYGDGPLVTDVPGVYFLRGRFKSGAPSGFTAKSDVDSESEFNVTYIRKEIGGRSILEFDPINGIHKVNGQDVRAQKRANLGLI